MRQKWRRQKCSRAEMLAEELPTRIPTYMPTRIDQVPALLPPNFFNREGFKLFPPQVDEDKSRTTLTVNNCFFLIGANPFNEFSLWCSTGKYNRSTMIIPYINDMIKPSNFILFTVYADNTSFLRKLFLPYINNC